MSTSDLNDTLQGLGARFPRKLGKVSVMGSTLFALFLFSISAITVAIALQIENEWSKAPNWIIGGLGGFFAFWGCYFVWNVVAHFRREKKYEKLLQGYPTGRWSNDYYWDPKGTIGESDADIAGSFGGIIISIVFGALFFGLFRVHQDKISFLGLLLFTLLVFSCIGFFLFIHLTIKAIRNKFAAGKTFLAFDTFPYFLGESLQTRLLLDFDKDVKKVSATLRCRSEYYAEKVHYWLLALGKLPMKETVLKTEENYTKTIIIEEPYRKDKGQIPIVFDLPSPETMSTSLSSSAITYWELVVTVELMFQMSFRKVFLIPIYYKSKVE